VPESDPAETAARDQDIASIRDDGESFARWWRAAREAGAPALVAAVGLFQWHQHWLTETCDDDE
jgi:hypothetical protein